MSDAVKADFRRALDRAAGPALFSGDDMDAHELATPTPAAVLVPVILRDPLHLLLTVRDGDMRTHAGQVAFPGGKMEPGEDAVAAALREAEEELAIPRQSVDVVGTLDPYRTGSDFLVTPVLGLVPDGLAITAQPGEVADWFEAPLDALLDRANHRREQAEYRGRARNYWRIVHDDHYIWGATAAMIVNLSHRLRP